MKRFLITAWVIEIRGGLEHKITEYVSAKNSAHAINKWKKANASRVHQILRVEAIEV